MGELYYKKSDIDAIFEKAISKYDYRNMAVLDALYEVRDAIYELEQSSFEEDDLK